MFITSHYNLFAIFFFFRLADDLLPSNSFSTSCEAKMEEEILKKKIKNDAVELLYSISAKIKKISSAQQMDTVIKDLRMQQT